MSFMKDIRIGRVTPNLHQISSNSMTSSAELWDAVLSHLQGVIALLGRAGLTLPKNDRF